MFEIGKGGQRGAQGNPGEPGGVLFAGPPRCPRLLHEEVFAALSIGCGGAGDPLGGQVAFGTLPAVASESHQEVFAALSTEPLSYELLKSNSYLVSKFLQNASGTMYVAHACERFVAIALNRLCGRLRKRRSKS